MTGIRDALRGISDTLAVAGVFTQDIGGNVLRLLVALVECAGRMGNRLDQAEAAIGAVNQTITGELRTLQDKVALLARRAGKQ